jgi:transcriptional regulator with XRE-family HTH domain
MTNQAGETPELDEVELGARIHTLMWRRKLTQADLGRALGVLQPTAGKKIRGEVKISAIELLKIANWLDVSPNQLLAPLAPEGRLPQARPRPEIINDDMSWYRTPAERWNLPEDPNSDTHG